MKEGMICEDCGYWGFQMHGNVRRCPKCQGRLRPLKDENNETTQPQTEASQERKGGERSG